MPTEKRYEINELTDTESTADAGNMLNGKAVVDEPTVTEFTEIESMDEIIKLFGVFDENLKIIEAETGTNIAADSEKINISGKQSAVAIARNVVEKLLSLIKRGESIDRGRIRYAIDLAREGNSELILELADDVIAFTSKGKQIKCKTLGQKRYINALKHNTVVFGVGPAGTGKTYLAVAMAVLAYKNKEVSRIILTRPAVEAGEKLGFLPGDLQNKVDPYLRPLYDALYDFLGSENFRILSERGVIEVAPLAYMRGRTLNDAYIILDEAQNCTVEQMKMFLVTVLRFYHSIPVKFIFQFCHSLDENPFFIMTDHFTEFVKRTTSRMPAQEIPFWQQAPECIQILCGSGHNALLLLRQRFRWLLSGQEARVGSYRSGMQRQDSYNFQKHRLCPARENFSR